MSEEPQKYTWQWQGIERGFDAPQWVNDTVVVVMFSIPFICFIIATAQFFDAK